MARYFDVHPASPQRRTIIQIADVVRAAVTIAASVLGGPIAAGARLTATSLAWPIGELTERGERHAWAVLAGVA